MDVNSDCFKIENQFNLDFIQDYRGDSDEKLLIESIKHFKNTNTKPANIQFLEGREIRMLAEFFTRYGETIRLIYIYFTHPKLYITIKILTRNLYQ